MEVKLMMMMIVINVFLNTALTGTDEVPSITLAFSAKIRPVIDLIDKLRHLGLEKEISLPTIVVVGDQSSGKSSTLEALSGVQLPRGSGIVTRCPLELRMKFRRDFVGGEDNSGWKGRIRYHPADSSEVDETFEDPEEVETRVRAAQDRLAGPDKGISDSVISLEIESPIVPDLTLVDLPGITRVAVEGHKDFSEQIKTMIMGYISKENTIILVIIPANVDIATTEALKLAKEVDPDGSRTVGVVTKPNLIDPGSESEIVSVVSNQRFKLKRGYTMIKCRDQTQINEKMSLKDAMEDEENFFRSRTHFSGLVSKGLTGAKNLSNKLSMVLFEHIQSCLPALKADIRHELEKVNKELDEIGEGIPEGAEAKRKLLNKILQSFTETVSKIADSDMKFDDEKTTELLNLYMGARDAFEKFAKDMEVETPTNVNDPQFLKKIKDNVKQQRRSELPMFMGYPVCKNLIKEVLSKFQPAAKQCRLTVNDIVGSIFESAVHLLANQYPEMEIAIKEIVHGVQKQSNDICKDRISEIFRMEELVFTQDDNFATTYGTVMSIAPPRCSAQYDATGRFSDCESERLAEIFRTYMNLCRQRLADTIPMTIMLYVVKDSSDKIKHEVWNLLSDQDSSRLLCEDKEIVQRRSYLKDKSKRLHQAADELRRF